MSDTEARQRYLSEAGSCLDAVGMALLGFRNLSVDITGFSVRGPRDADEGILIVVRGTNGEGKPVVSFLSGNDLPSLFVSFAAFIRQGSFTWKEDTYRTKS